MHKCALTEVHWKWHKELAPAKVILRIALCVNQPYEWARPAKAMVLNKLHDPPQLCSTQISQITTFLFQNSHRYYFMFSHLLRINVIYTNMIL